MTRTATALFSSPDLQVLDVRCACPRGHVDEEESTGWEVVLPMSGLFRRRTSAEDDIIDASAAYVGRPGGAQRIEHVTDGDRCVAVRMSEQLADDLGATASSAIRTRAAHRLVATARRGVDEDAWLQLLASLFPRVHSARWPTDQQRRAVAAVREAIAGDPGGAWDLRSLARVAGYAPHHLSRIFRRTTGITITQHRDGVRLGRAAELVADGVPIADVAAELGFADHGHLTRRSRAVLGVTPSQLRA